MSYTHTSATTFLIWQVDLLLDELQADASITNGRRRAPLISH